MKSLTLVVMGALLLGFFFQCSPPPPDAPPVESTTPQATPSLGSATGASTPIQSPIASPSQITYLVESGDTLSSIAARFGTTYQAIMELNGITSTMIYSGTELLIPVEQALASPSPSSTTSPSPTPALPSPTERAEPPSSTAQALKSDLEWVLSDYPQVTLLGVRISGRDLFVQVALERTELAEFFEAIGAIHGTVGEVEPDVDRVIIEDVTGQRIIVRMSDLLAHYRGYTTFYEFRDTWQVVNP